MAFDLDDLAEYLAVSARFSLDAVSEFWFQNEEARVAAFATPQGKAAAEDAAAHCSFRVHLLTQEKVII